MNGSQHMLTLCRLYATQAKVTVVAGQMFVPLYGFAGQMSVPLHVTTAGKMWVYAVECLIRWAHSPRSNPPMELL